MRNRQSLGHTLVMALIAAGTTWAALIAWRGFMQSPSHYLGPLVIVAATIAASGALLRWLGAPALVTVAVQAALAFVVLCNELVGSTMPTGGTWSQMSAALDAAVQSAQRYAAPIGNNVPSVAPLLICGGTIVLLLVDFLACTLRKVPVAGLGLLAIYSVPIGVPNTGSAWLSFLGATTGFLALLHLDTSDRLLRWGRALGPVSTGSTVAAANPMGDAIRAGAGRIGVTATALALAVPLVVPVMELGLFGFGQGNGDDQITIHNPRTDLRRDLEAREDVPLIDIETDDPDPAYLRVAVLNRFTGLEWSSGDRDVDPDNQANGELPAPQGVDAIVPFTTYQYQVEVHDLDSTWLPTQFPATSVEADGDWRYDPATMDFIASADQNTAGLDYEMTAVDYDFGSDPSFFRNAASGQVDDELTELPAGVPDNVEHWATTVTREGTTDYEKATLLQDWFRSEFRYNLGKAPEGIGNDTLESFVAPTGRVGYCEQFASAMAVMARILDIPARVAVGFLRPTANDDGTFTYSSDDLHAWPELYFAGSGWVRFEPTPAGRAVNVPGYSEVPESLRPDGAGNENTTAPSSAGSAAPSQSRSEANRPSAAPEEQADRRDGDGRTTWGGRFGWLLVLVLALGALAALGCVPRLLRGRLRQRRVLGPPDAVWRELHATAIDLGVPWPEGRSPRQIGTALAEHLGDRSDPRDVVRPRTGGAVDPNATASLERIVHAVERARYARAGGTTTEPGELADDVTACLDALAAGVTSRARRRATWLPRSLARGRTRDDESASDQPAPLASAGR